MSRMDMELSRSLILRSPPQAGVSKDAHIRGRCLHRSFETPACGGLLRMRQSDARLLRAPQDEAERRPPAAGSSG